jgi:hypothetical protein
LDLLRVLSGAVQHRKEPIGQLQFWNRLLDTIEDLVVDFVPPQCALGRRHLQDEDGIHLLLERGNQFLFVTQGDLPQTRQIDNSQACHIPVRELDEDVRTFHGQITLAAIFLGNKITNLVHRNAAGLVRKVLTDLSDALVEMSHLLVDTVFFRETGSKRGQGLLEIG